MCFILTIITGFIIPFIINIIAINTVIIMLPLLFITIIFIISYFITCCFIITIFNNTISKIIVNYIIPFITNIFTTPQEWEEIQSNHTKTLLHNQAMTRLNPYEFIIATNAKSTNINRLGLYITKPKIVFFDGLMG